jgi:hypothetical protein
MLKQRILFFALLVVLPCIAWGQGYGSISGVVSDPSGAVVPRATITATEVGTKTVTTGISNSEGQYNILDLRPGLYAIAAEAPGFKKLLQPDVRLEVAGRITLDLHLQVGATSETVSVTAQAPLLRTEDAQTGEVIDTTMINNLPQLDRNALELVQLSGNVQGSGLSTNGGSPIGGNPATGNTSPGDLAIAGGRTGELEYAVDGQNINSGRGHDVENTAIPTMESVAEFKVITGGLSAEYGRSSGGIVEVVSRGGTNQLHGEGFEFFRNNMLNANSWLQNATGGESTPYKQNIYGGYIGGPVVLPKIYNGRNRTFWFFNFQGTKYRQAAVNTVGGVPTAAERTGDLTSTLYNGASPLMYDPLGDTAIGSDGNLVRTTLLGGNGLIVPASQISPMTAKILADLPLPNRPATAGFSEYDNYIGQQGTSTNDANWTFRIDENLTDRQRLSFRFKRENYTTSLSSWLGVLNPPVDNKMKEALNSNLNYDFVVSPTLIVSARMGVTAVPNISGPVWPSTFKSSDWPYDPQMKTWTTQDRLPFSIILSSNGGWGGSRLTNTDYPHSSIAEYTTYNPAVTLTKILSKHTLKFGVETRRYYDNMAQTTLGWMTFDGSATIPTFPGTWTQSNQNMVSANSMGDFLLGDLGYTQAAGAFTFDENTNYWAAFIQDDYRLTPKLTLNLGLRWDMEEPMSERYNNQVAWDSNAPSAFTIPSSWTWNSALSAAGLTTAQIAQVQEPQWAVNGKFPNGAMAETGTTQYPGHTLQPIHWNHFAPRLGAAYKLNDKTTLRTSFSVLYISTTGDYYSNWTTVVPGTSGAGATDLYSPTGVPEHTWNQVFLPDELLYYQHTVPEANYSIGGSLGSTAWSTNTDMPREYQWNFTVQRQLSSSMIAEAAYSGNHSGTLMAEDSLNPFPGQYLNPALGNLLATQIQNPIAGQIMSNPSAFTGPTVPLGALLNSNPSRGQLYVQGVNAGSSMYNALNLRLERRMSKGVTFLLNYTYSKLLDDVGGENMNFWGTGSFAKGWQPTDTFRNTYSYDPNDRTNRLTFYSDVQMPLGKGRKFLGNPQTTGEKILDYVVGGWELAGFGLWESGTPIAFGTVGGVSSLGQGAPGLFGFINGSTSQISTSSLGSGSLLRSPADGYTVCGGGFNCSEFGLPQLLTYGNMGSIYPWIRNPGYLNYDASLMKRFNFTEHSYLQLRVEAQNVFNIRGLGPYDTTFGDAHFGYITSAGNTPRIMQVSGRIFF